MKINKFVGKLKNNSEKLINTVSNSELASQVTGKVSSFVDPLLDKGDKDEMSMSAIKRQIKALVNEKAKVYEFIGMEVHEMYQENGIEVLRLEPFLEKLNTIENELTKLNQKKEDKQKNKKLTTCECGQKIDEETKFCPGCGKKVNVEPLVCHCGTELGDHSSFCPNCGSKREEIESSSDAIETTAMIECVCGAMVAIDQAMCMECGRRVVCD